MSPQDFAAGFALSLSLIIAIGAQNVFVIRCGVRRQHVVPVALFCIVSDGILISLGVFGVASIIRQISWLESLMTYAGGAFLIAYGFIIFLRAFRQPQQIEEPVKDATTLKQAIFVCFVLTWLNPHVYLDTLVLIGMVSTQYSDRLAFAAGGVAASAVFFTILGTASSALSPFLSKPSALRAIDIVSALIMWVVAYSILA